MSFDDNENIVSEQQLVQDLTLIKMDVQSGFAYCGDKDGYITILKAFLRKSDTVKQKIEKAYEQKDWERYTIEVHGLKSSMKSIGAMDISNMALELELAGKAGNIEFIEGNAAQLIEAYDDFFSKLRSISWLCPQVSQVVQISKDEVKCEVITSIQFEELIDKMEQCVYALDTKMMLELAQKLKTSEYKGNKLDSLTIEIFEKMENDDLFSAIDMLKELKDNLD